MNAPYSFVSYRKTGEANLKNTDVNNAMEKALQDNQTVIFTHIDPNDKNKTCAIKTVAEFEDWRNHYAEIILKEHEDDLAVTIEDHRANFLVDEPDLILLRSIAEQVNLEISATEIFSKKGEVPASYDCTIEEAPDVIANIVQRFAKLKKEQAMQIGRKTKN